MSGELTLFARGAALGLAVSAPLGPIGVMCIRETLVRGMRSGLAVGLGAATADLIYATIAAFGLSAVMDSLAPAVPPLRALAGGILAWLAWKAFRTPGQLREPAAEANGAAGASYVTGFVLLISNPAAVVIFGGVFVGLGLTAAGNATSAMAVVAGVVVGAVTWWVTLSGAAAALRSRVTAGGLRVVNVLSGMALAGFAVVAWWGLW